MCVCVIIITKTHNQAIPSENDSYIHYCSLHDTLINSSLNPCPTLNDNDVVYNIIYHTIVSIKKYYISV